jgi:hypothetical protein
MSISSAFCRVLSWAAAMAAGAMVAQAQVTITGADMFTQVGQYYITYANSNSSGTVDVSAWVTPASSTAQAWDFTTGPHDVTNRYDYLAATNTPNGADFAAVGAQMAQQLTVGGSTNGLQWLYFTEDPSKGQLDYGFYNPSFSSSQPESVFTNALQDFPISIHYGDSWSGATVFYSTYSLAGLGDFPVQITYTSTDTVDAFGLVTLPNIGFLDCLRVHELDEYDIAFDVGEGYQDAGAYYVLNYYWFAPGHGMVAQINSQQDTSVPPDNLGGQAASVERMFEAYHPAATNSTPTTISGFKITPGSTAFLLQWTPIAGVSSYTVNYTTNLAGTITWQSLGSTASNFMLDPAAAKPGAPARYYRVVGALGPK